MQPQDTRPPWHQASRAKDFARAKKGQNYFCKSMKYFLSPLLSGVGDAGYRTKQFSWRSGLQRLEEWVRQMFSVIGFSATASLLAEK
jgi:hypothetical protein